MVTSDRAKAMTLLDKIREYTDDTTILEYVLKNYLPGETSLEALEAMAHYELDLETEEETEEEDEEEN